MSNLENNRFEENIQIDELEENNVEKQTSITKNSESI